MTFALGECLRKSLEVNVYSYTLQLWIKVRINIKVHGRI
jgi:hypothetical protein